VVIQDTRLGGCLRYSQDGGIGLNVEACGILAEQTLEDPGDQAIWPNSTRSKDDCAVRVTKIINLQQTRRLLSKNCIARACFLYRHGALMSHE
jgi:hypothetical protein